MIWRKAGSVSTYFWTCCLEFTALGRGVIAIRSLATSDNMIYDVTVPYSPRYPKNSDKCQS